MPMLTYMSMHVSEYGETESVLLAVAAVACIIAMVVGSIKLRKHK